MVQALENKQNAAVLYKDYVKYFDNRDHGVEVHKLYNMEIVGAVRRTYSFLINRSRHAAVNQTISVVSMV